MLESLWVLYFQWDYIFFPLIRVQRSSWRNTYIFNFRHLFGEKKYRFMCSLFFIRFVCTQTRAHTHTGARKYVRTYLYWVHTRFNDLGDGNLFNGKLSTARWISRAPSTLRRTAFEIKLPAPGTRVFPRRPIIYFWSAAALCPWKRITFFDQTRPRPLSLTLSSSFFFSISVLVFFFLLISAGQSNCRTIFSACPRAWCPRERYNILYNNNIYIRYWTADTPPRTRAG